MDDPVLVYGITPPPGWDKSPLESLDLNWPGWHEMSRGYRLIEHARKSKIGPKRSNRPRRRM